MLIKLCYLLIFVRYIIIKQEPIHAKNEPVPVFISFYEKYTSSSCGFSAGSMETG